MKPNQFFSRTKKKVKWVKKEEKKPFNIKCWSILHVFYHFALSGFSVLFYYYLLFGFNETRNVKYYFISGKNYNFFIFGKEYSFCFNSFRWTSMRHTIGWNSDMWGYGVTNSNGAMWIKSIDQFFFVVHIHRIIYFRLIHPKSLFFCNFGCRWIFTLTCHKQCHIYVTNF